MAKKSNEERFARALENYLIKSLKSSDAHVTPMRKNRPSPSDCNNCTWIGVTVVWDKKYGSYGVLALNWTCDKPHLWAAINIVIEGSEFTDIMQTSKTGKQYANVRSEHKEILHRHIEESMRPNVELAEVFVRFIENTK